MFHPLMREIDKLVQYFPRRRARFQLNGKAYPYFCHQYNKTWMNERCVEVPLVMDFVKPGLRVLEVGRVLDHYVPFPHDCVDKFEKGAINMDVVDFRSSEPYDLIVSISTLEHVGWDEDRNPEKIFRAIEVLTGQLKPGGKLVVTVPFGYNQNLQRNLEEGRRLFQEQYYLESGPFGWWKQVESPSIKDYNFRDGAAKAIILGVTTA